MASLSSDMSPTTLESELAVKASLIDALNAENEQLRDLLQRHVDQAESSETKRFSRGDMRRESNINELQAALACMRSQLHDTAGDYEEQKKLASNIKEDKSLLEQKLAAVTQENAELKATIKELQDKLEKEHTTLEEERLRIATLRNGLEESKRAIVILQEQNERRQSEAAAARRASLESQGILPSLGGSTASRRGSLAFPNVSEARRGSLNYLNGLGLATKRTAYFDPSKPGQQQHARMHGSLADAPGMADTMAEHEVLAKRRASMPAAGILEAIRGTDQQQQDDNPKTGLPTSASSPHLNGAPFNMNPRKGSLANVAAARRSSIGYESSPTRRNSHLAHTLSRLGANGSTAAELDLPISRRGSRVLASDMSGLGSLPEYGLGDPARTRRRSSLLVGPHHVRRTSDKPIPLVTRDSADMSLVSSKITNHEPSTIITGDEGEGIVHALSLEAVMEISSLRETVNQLQLQLLESEEAREASETCAKVLREFIASQTVAETTNSTTPIRLPPLPTEADELDSSTPHARIKSDRSAGEAKKSSSLWTIPKMLPTLSYGSNKKEVPASPVTSSRQDSLPFGIVSTSKMSELLVPSRIADIRRRTSSIDSRSEYSCQSGPNSPFMGLQSQPTFAPSFESFSFAAHRGARPGTPTLLPPSPGVGPKDADRSRFPDSASSTEDSESEAEPVTPMDAVFDEKSIGTPKPSRKGMVTFDTGDAIVAESSGPVAILRV